MKSTTSVTSFAICAILTFVPAQVYAFSGGGSGTSNDPYIITDCSELQEMEDDLSAHYELGGDVDCSGTTGWNGGKGFDPVGEDNNAFSGVLDGNDNVITGLFIDRGNHSEVGLFGETTASAIIKNVGVEDVDITDTGSSNFNFTGALVGRNYGTVESAHSTGVIDSAGWNVGGLIGAQEDGSVSESYASTTVTSDGPRTGGFVGENDGGDIDKSYAIGDVNIGNPNASNQVGGFVGIQLHDNGTNASIKDSYSSGDVNGGFSVGGFAGFVDDGSVTNSYTIGSVTDSDDDGFAGGNSTVSSSYWNTETSNANGSEKGTGKTTSQLKTQSTYSGWDFTNIWNISAGTNNGYPFLRWQSFDTPPSVSSFSPADDATDVAVGSNLSITFDETVNAGSGNVTLKKASDDSTIEAIDVTSGQVTGGGSDTITINPSGDLAENTQYYVRIDSTAFDDTTGNDYAGISATTTWNFTTEDATAASLSSLTASTTSSSSTISWSTNENASTQIEYGLTSSYGATTTETNTSTRVTSHSQTVSGLASCAQYHYRVRSTDAAGNQAVGSDNTFTTTGCNGGSSITTSNSVEDVATSTGGSLTQGNVSLSIPSGYRATSSLTFQANVLDGTTFFNNVSNPSGLSRAGSYAYNLKALLDATTTVSTFDNAVTVTLSYTDSDVTGLDEYSLKIHRYDGSSWNELSKCSVDSGANTVSCETSQFSEFSIFGTEESTDTTGSDSGPGISGGGYINGPPGYNEPDDDTDPAEDEQENGRAERIAELKAQIADIKARLAALVQSGVSSTCTFSRDLEFGMTGDDVKCLQQYLNTNGFQLADAGPGSPGNETDYFGPRTKDAVVRFQEANSEIILAPLGLESGTGYVGPATRSHVNNY